jgi:hypothetical protein
VKYVVRANPTQTGYWFSLDTLVVPLLTCKRTYITLLLFFIFFQLHAPTAYATLQLLDVRVVHYGLQTVMEPAGASHILIFFYVYKYMTDCKIKISRKKIENNMQHVT